MLVPSFRPVKIGSKNIVVRRENTVGMHNKTLIVMTLWLRWVSLARVWAVAGVELNGR